MPWFANFEMTQLTKYGMPGVWTHAFVDMWSPGLSRVHVVESQRHDAHVRDVRQRRRHDHEAHGRQSARFPGATNQTTREWYRPIPPYKEVMWSMRNNTNYMQTAVLSALQLTSEFPKVVLENFYVKSRNSVETGKKGAARVRHSGRTEGRHTRGAAGQPAAGAGNRSRSHQGRAEAHRRHLPAGSYVVKRDQPYGRLAKILLEKQDFPDANLRTYDDTGWTMGLMLQTEVKAIADKAILSAATDPVSAEVKTGRDADGRAGSGRDRRPQSRRQQRW